MAFQKVAGGEEIMPEMQGFKMACCDCGLVHTMNFNVREVVSGPNEEGIYLTVEPDNVEKLRIFLTADRDEIGSGAERRGIIEYLDKILETQGRLTFAKENYNETEADLFGFAILEFLRMNGLLLRAALVQYIDGLESENGRLD